MRHENGVVLHCSSRCLIVPEILCCLYGLSTTRAARWYLKVIRDRTAQMKGIYTYWNACDHGRHLGRCSKRVARKSSILLIAKLVELLPAVYYYQFWKWSEE